MSILLDKLMARRHPKYDAPKSFAGIPITIENPIGSTRSGRNKQGKEWSVKMKHHYGFINKANGSDGEGLDVFLGPDKWASNAYVIHQNEPSTGQYDEDKVMLGFRSPEGAKSAYLSNYDTPKFYRSMTIIPMPKFKEMLTKGEPGSVHWKKKHGRSLEAHAMFSSDTNLLQAVAAMRRAKKLCASIAMFAAEEEKAKSRDGGGDSDGKWITLHGESGHGQHVHIDNEKNIDKGPGDLAGKNLNNLDKHPLYDKKIGHLHDEGEAPKGASASKQLGMFGGQAGQEIGELTGEQQSMFGKEPPKEKQGNTADDKIARQYDPEATEPMFGEDKANNPSDRETPEETNANAADRSLSAGEANTGNRQPVPQAEGNPFGETEDAGEAAQDEAGLQQQEVSEEDPAAGENPPPSVEDDMPDDFLAGIEDENEQGGPGDGEQEADLGEGIEANPKDESGQPEKPSDQSVAQAANRGEISEDELMNTHPHLAGDAMVERHKREAKEKALAEKEAKDAAANPVAMAGEGVEQDTAEETTNPQISEPQMSEEDQNAAMSSSAIDRALQSYFDETSGESQQAIQDEKDLAPYQNPYEFSKSEKTKSGLPGEVERMKEKGKGRQKNLTSTTSDTAKSNGSDAIGDLGEEKYQQIMERQGSMQGRMSKALEHAKKSPDPRIRLLAAIRDTFSSNESEDRRKKKQPVPANQLETGTKGKINGIDVEVVDENGEKVLKDGDDLPETPIDALVGTNVPFDKGSLQQSGQQQKPQAPAARESEIPSPQAKSEPTTTPETSSENPPLSETARPETPGSQEAEAPAMEPEQEETPEGETEPQDPQQVENDIRDALITLGMNRKDADVLTQEAMATGVSDAAEGVKAALLKRMGGGSRSPVQARRPAPATPKSAPKPMAPPTKYAYGGEEHGQLQKGARLQKYFEEKRKRAQQGQTTVSNTGSTHSHDESTAAASPQAQQPTPKPSQATRTSPVTQIPPKTSQAPKGQGNRPAPGWPKTRPGTSPPPLQPVPGFTPTKPPTKWTRPAGSAVTHRPIHIKPNGKVVSLSRTQGGKTQTMSPAELNAYLSKKPASGKTEKIPELISPLKPLPAGQGVHGHISNNPLWKYGIRSQPGQSRAVKPKQGHRLTEEEVRRAKGEEKQVSNKTHFSADRIAGRILKLIGLLK